MVAIDAGFLGLLLHPSARPPDDPTTNKPIVRLSECIEKLEEDWLFSRERVLVPTPALAEFLVLADADGPAILAELNLRPNFYIRAFDQVAAVELASMEILSRKSGSKRAPASVHSPWQKVKFDRQIIAIARANQATAIYSDDDDVRNIAEDVGIKAISCWELDLPASKTPLLDNDLGPIDV